MGGLAPLATVDGRFFTLTCLCRIDETLCQVDGEGPGLEESIKSDPPPSLDGSDSKTKTDGNMGNG